LITPIRKKKTLQPLICVVGADFQIAKDFYVYYFNTYYKFSSIIRAVDICFKIFQVFNLKYSIQSILVWTFIQHYFYNIHCESDVTPVSTSTLVAQSLYFEHIKILFLPNDLTLLNNAVC
jgi:hypothetical protein